MRRIGKFYFVVILIGIFLIIYIAISSISHKKQQSKLENQGITDTAIVIREFTGAKRKLYFEYVFSIEKEKFNGFLQYSPSYGSVSVGDSFLVRYLPSDPDEINELITGKDHCLNKINR